MTRTKLVVRITLVLAGGFPFMAATALAADAPSSLEETFEYPGAEAIFAAEGARLVRGDGQIVLTSCDDDKNVIVVQSTDTSSEKLCFQVLGPRGFLSMELPGTYFLRGNTRKDVTATLTDDAGEQATISVPAGKWVPSLIDNNPAVLIEIRAGS